MQIRHRKLVPLLALGLLAAGCTPNKVLKGGPVAEQARSVAERFCAAALAGELRDRRDLFSSELLAALTDPVLSEQGRKVQMTSVDAAPRCEPGLVRRFGYHPDQDISIQVHLRGATDILRLSDTEPGRIEDIVYDRKQLRPDQSYSFLSELKWLRVQAQRRPGG